MRPLLLLCSLLAMPALADTTPAEPATPQAGSAEWRSLTAALDAYCRRHPTRICHEIVHDLRHRPTDIYMKWRDAVLDVDSRFACHSFNEARLTRDARGWRVLSVEEAIIPHQAPKFD
jgi:hypothetical protein